MPQDNRPLVIITRVDSSRPNRPNFIAVTTSSVTIVSTCIFSTYTWTSQLLRATSKPKRLLGLWLRTSIAVMFAGVFTDHCCLPWMHASHTTALTQLASKCWQQLYKMWKVDYFHNHNNNKLTFKTCPNDSTVSLRHDWWQTSHK